MAEIFTNDPSDTLAALAGAGDALIVVTSGSQFPASGTFRIRIDNEIMTVTAVSGTSWSVTRASEAVGGVQTASAHAAGAGVYGVLTAGSLGTLGGGGGGTVTTVSVVSANGVSGSVANPTTMPAITISLGAITPSSIVASGTISGSNLSGTNTGDQDLSGYVPTSRTVNGHALSGNVTVSASDVGAPSGSGTSTGANTGDQTITLTSDVTGSGTGSFVTTIAGHAVTYAKMQQVAAVSILGNSTGSAHDAQELTLGTGLAFSSTTIAVQYGTSGTTACVGNDSRLSDARTPVGTALTSANIWIGSSGNLAAAVAVTGDVTITNAGVTAIGANKVTTTTINANAVTYAKIQQASASTLLGNPTGSAANVSEITLGSGVAFSGTTLTATGLGGTVTSVGLTMPSQFSVGGTPVTTSGTLAVTLAAPMILANGSQAFTADQSLGTHKLTNVVDPVSAQDAATKNYVDTQLALIAIKQECQAATTAALALSTYANGSSGVGATITLTVAAVLVLDGYTPALNDRLLVKNQADPTENGIYYLSRVGTISITAQLTRSLDFDQPADGINGAFTFIQSGTVNAATGWLCNTFGSITFGHGGTSINFVQDTGSGTYTGTSPIAVSAANVISTGVIPTTLGGLGSDTSAYTLGQIPVAQGGAAYSADGRRGLYTGTGVPSAGLGFPTDYYIDLASGTIYLKS